jgi:hypothetical protein
MVSKAIYTYFIYTRILLFYLFGEIGYGGSFSFHETFQIILFLGDDNHVHKCSISLDIIQLVENIVFSRGKRRRSSLIVKSLGILFNNNLRI